MDLQRLKNIQSQYQTEYFIAEKGRKNCSLVMLSCQKVAHKNKQMLQQARAEAVM